MAEAGFSPAVGQAAHKEETIRYSDVSRMVHKSDKSTMQAAVKSVQSLQEVVSKFDAPDSGSRPQTVRVPLHPPTLPPFWLGVSAHALLQSFECACVRVLHTGV